MSIAEAAIPTPYIHSSQKRRKNIWFSQKDGNWSDPNTWISNALSYCQFNFNYPGVAVPAPIFPNVGDDVYINHTVTLDVGTFTSPIVINNLYISGTFKAGATQRYISVNGDLQCVGAVDFTSSNVNVNLYGVNNFINSFTAGTSTINFTRSGDQNVMNLSYYNLSITSPNGFGTKYLTGNQTVSNNLVMNYSNGGAGFDTLTYTLTVNGTTTTTSAKFYNTGGGTMTFIGLYTNSGGMIQFTGNPNIEFRNGFTMSGNSLNNTPLTDINFGTGTITFTTNNQTFFNNQVSIALANNITISGSLSVTFDTAGKASTFSVNNYIKIGGTINGTVAGSKLINKGVLFFDTTSTQMSTGSFDTTTNTDNMIGYVMNASYTVPLTSYYGLYISGTGTKTLSGNTSVSTWLYISNNINASGTLDSNNFTITLTSAKLTITNASLTYSGNLVVGGIGNIQAGTLNNGVSTFTLECQNGLTFSAGSIPTGFALKFSVNNQGFATNAANSSTFNITISGAITVQFFGSPIITGTINGDNANSILDNRGSVGYQNATAPMVTGKLYCNQASNTWLYNMGGNQDIQVLSDPVSPGYYNLTLSVSGAKKLLGNVSVKHTYSLVAPATLNSNGFILSNP